MVLMSPEGSADRVLEKVIEVIANQSSARSTDNEKKNCLKCFHHFGYLSEINKNTPIPEECFFCPRVVECITKK